MRGLEDDEDEDDLPQEMTPGHHEVAVMDYTGELSELLLELIGNTTKVLALLLETDEYEFAANAQRLQMFFDLVNQMPTEAMHKNEPTRPVGFQPPKALPRKRQKPKKKKLKAPA